MRTKKCPNCTEIKYIDEFHNSTARYDGKQPYCKDCVYLKKQGYNYSVQQKKNWRLKSKYGISLDDFVRVSSLLDNKCAICKKNVNLHVDHDHTCCSGDKSCGKCVRGLLCINCNNGLGSFKDDPQLLTKAINYINYTKEISLFE